MRQQSGRLIAIPINKKNWVLFLRLSLGFGEDFSKYQNISWGRFWGENSGLLWFHQSCGKLLEGISPCFIWVQAFLYPLGSVTLFNLPYWRQLTSFFWNRKIPFIKSVLHLDKKKYCEVKVSSKLFWIVITYALEIFFLRQFIVYLYWYSFLHGFWKIWNSIVNMRHKLKTVENVRHWLDRENC